MKSLLSTLAAFGLTFVLPASAATTDPEVIIYRFPGVLDLAAGGVATVFHCTNFSGATETVRWVTRSQDGTLLANVAQSLPHLSSIAMSTQIVLSYSNTNMNTGQFGEGTTAIAATSTSVSCTAMVLDSSATKPTGVSLRGIRFNPIPGSQE